MAPLIHFGFRASNKPIVAPIGAIIGRRFFSFKAPFYKKSGWRAGDYFCLIHRGKHQKIQGDEGAFTHGAKRARWGVDWCFLFILVPFVFFPAFLGPFFILDSVCQIIFQPLGWRFIFSFPPSEKCLQGSRYAMVPCPIAKPLP